MAVSSATRTGTNPSVEFRRRPFSRQNSRVSILGVIDASRRPCCAGASAFTTALPLRAKLGAKRIAWRSAMKAGCLLLFLATVWLALFGAVPGRAVSVPFQVGLMPPF